MVLNLLRVPVKVYWTLSILKGDFLKGLFSLKVYVFTVCISYQLCADTFCASSYSENTIFNMLS